MKHAVAFTLNLPWTVWGIYQALLCGIHNVHYKDRAFIFIVDNIHNRKIKLLNLAFVLAFFCLSNALYVKIILIFIALILIEFSLLARFVVAITRGHTIIIEKKYEHDATILRHEYVHVEQADRYFGFFPILYAFEFLKEGLKILWQGATLFCKAGYWNNKFEKEAYERAAKEIAEKE